MSLDSDIASAFNSAKSDYLASIDAAKTKAQTELTSQSDAVQKAAQSLSENFAGFLTGRTPPAYSTDNSSVLVRDPFYGQNGATSNTSTSSIPTKGYFIIAVGISIWYFLKRRKK